MWKSASSIISSKIGSSGGERSGSFRQQIKNDRSGRIGQPEQDADSIRQLWETAMDGVESSAWEDINEELWIRSRTSISSDTSSSSLSSSPIARQGGKLLQVVKSKVNFSRGSKKATQTDRVSVHDAEDSSRSRNSRTQDGEIVSDKLMEELETLRRKLEKKEKEMQKLNNEVSTLRITRAIQSVQPQSQSRTETSPQEDTSRRYSADSDSSQLSCLDFSFAPSSGDLKFEGKIKTKITSAATPRAECGDQPDSIVPDSAAVGAPRLVEQLSPITEVFAPEKIRSTTKGSALSRVHEPNVVDKHVEATKRSIDECEAKHCQPEYAARVCPNHTGGGLELPEKAVKEELYISTQSYLYKTKEELLDINPNESRSPPKSISSTEEEDDFEFPILFSDSSNSLFLQKAIAPKVTYCVSAARSSCDLSDVEVDDKARLVITKDYDEVDENVQTVPFSDETTSNSSPAKEDTLQMVMNSCASLEVDKLSNTMTSLRKEESLTRSKCPDLITKPTLVTSPLLRREESVTTTKHSDLISTSTSVLSPARSRPVAAQGYPSRGVRVSQESLDLQVKAGDSVEQRETEEFISNRIEMDLGLKFLAMSTSTIQGSIEPMDGSNGLDFDNLPLPNSHRRSGYGSTSQSREYTTTIADRREGWSRVLPSTSRRATTTSDRHEGPSPTSPSTSRRVRGPPSSCSGGSELLHEEFGWKPKSGRLQEVELEEEVRQILEQSRLLLMSDESFSEAERNVPGPARDKPFSVLALSRQKRSMEKSRISFRHTPEINQQQERPVQEEEQAMVLDGDTDAWNIESSIVDNFHEVDAERENEDHSLSHPPERRDAVEASYKKEDLQLVWELEVQNNKNQILSESQPRRSRFFFEANIAKTPEMVLQQAL